MSAAAIIAAPALVEGVRQGSEKAKAVYSHAVEAMTRELEVYDYEKVLWQGITGSTILLVGKLAYGIYAQLKIAEFDLNHPDFLVADYVQAWFGAMNWLTLGKIPFFNSIASIASLAKDTPEYKEAFENEVMNDPVMKFGKIVLEDYWLLILVGIWVAAALVEKRRVDVLARKRRRLMKLVTA